MENVTLYSLIELAIANEHGKPAVIKYRKLKSVVATNALVAEYEDMLEKREKQEAFRNKYPHLF